VIKQSIKDVYYAGLYWYSRWSMPVNRWRYRRRLASRDRLHLGCGKHYLNDFVNLDGNFQRSVDFIVDARAGLPLPDQSMQFVYSCHMLEHVLVDDALKILGEVHRVLKPGGYARFTLPDFRFVFEILNGTEYQYPRPFRSRDGQAISFLFCDGQHKFAYSAESLRELATPLGFSRIEAAGPDDPHIANVSALEPSGSFSLNLYR
jgi:SAM-dependent methyltransferase